MALTRQLPGISFLAEIPTVVDLPRMDICAFVGFAQRGPLHTPVAIESYAEFEDIFGGTYRLAWDTEREAWQNACLAPAVNAFFTQGGRRCWIVRVASERATTNQFPISGLLHSSAGDFQGLVAAARLAVLKRAAFIVVPASGGARMQEGILSLIWPYV